MYQEPPWHLLHEAITRNTNVLNSSPHRSKKPIGCHLNTVRTTCSEDIHVGAAGGKDPHLLCTDSRNG